ncbi:HAMP domain-containing sensor histidine kinase [Bacillus sp. CECT 9360]|uniref:sensor histidine kinase n=1 Tax=Bacillus sp. CECT 9360 TaxID=2845821 RepID=UPI001E41B745|nr:HAMP domain-containing sensor histidine kinase [Bacillus sp. CECT 9360]CAH0346669.1 Adaptive-response sensory-kinase SasA [Bacillus sp. CECT 9360]
MEIQYNNILLQMLMVLFPIILYLAITNDRYTNKKDHSYWGYICAITMGLTMAFAIKIDEGIFLDLRMVPWFLSFIYGGTTVGIWVTIFYFVIRFLLGGSGMIPAFIVMFLSSFVIFKFRTSFQQWERKKKILLSKLFLVVSSASIPFIGTIVLKEPLSIVRLICYVCFIIANGITVWLAIHLMESHREKQELLKEIQRNEKLHVVGQMAASVAHEIRNPMTSVRGFIQLLSVSNNITTSEKGFLNLCLNELDRANEIISDYLAFGKGDEIDQLSQVDISLEAMQSVKSLSSYSILHGVNVSLDICDRAIVMGIPSRLKQMFVNLIKNAIEAASPNGNVELKIYIRNQQVELTITDDGEGMNAQQIENLGLPYYSTKEKGTGLGLMVTLQIIREMGGNYTVKSNLNNGTAFKVTFPLI